MLVAKKANSLSLLRAYSCAGGSLVAPVLSARGDMSGWLSRLRSTFVVAEPAGAGSGSPDDGVSDADETLRRFETVVPGSYESGGPPNLPTAPTRADSPAGGAAPVATPLASLPVSERVAVCASQIRKAR